MRCRWRGNIANDLRTNLLDVTKGNGFSKLKGFLKVHDRFSCKPTQFTFPIKRQHFRIQKFKTIKGERKLEQITCILPYFNWCVQVFRLKAYNNACMHPFFFFVSLNF
jgi:hypothetical protein